MPKIFSGTCIKTSDTRIGERCPRSGRLKIIEDVKVHVVAEIVNNFQPSDLNSLTIN